MNPRLCQIPVLHLTLLAVSLAAMPATSPAIEPTAKRLPPTEQAANTGTRLNLLYILTDQQWAGAMSCAGNSDL